MIPAMRTALAVAVLLALTGCSGDDQGASSTTRDVITAMSSAVEAAPSCETDLAAGQVVPADIAATGCLGADGTIHVGSTFSCVDGRTLLQLDNPDRWGFTGSEIVASTTPEVASDPAYAAAVEACQG